MKWLKGYEHRLIAKEIAGVLKEHCPVTFAAAQAAGIIGTDDGVATNV